MKPRYYLPSGEALPKQETNVHHVWFQKYKYTSALERSLRSLPGFVVRMGVNIHNDLHEAVEPPIKPSGDLTHLIIQRSKEQPSGLDTYGCFIDQLQHIGRIATEAPSLQIREEAEQVYANLIDQGEFLRYGRIVYVSE